MTDENKTLETVAAEQPIEQTTSETTTATTQETHAEQAPTQEEEEEKALSSKADVLQYLQEVVAAGNDLRRQALEHCKQLYYRFQNEEAKAQYDAYLADGGDPEKFTPTIDTEEDKFKQLYEQIRQLRNEHAEQELKERTENLKRKQEIIEEIKAASVSAEEADKNYDKIKQLQAEWKTIGSVLPEHSTECWKTYQFYCEQFYDQLHLNAETRQYDFKRNLEAKTAICENAERLSQQEDVIDAFHGLQNLHHEFREIGPVEKELRADIWNRFKAASTLINKRYNDHFNEIKEKEEKNLQLKVALCERVEQIEFEKIQQASAWKKMTEQILQLQAEWRTIGFTPKKENAKIFDRWRTACDLFFQKKSDFYKELHKVQAENLEKKTKLVEEVEALKDSTDWVNVSSTMVKLQKAWKKIGPVPHKMSDELWNRFNNACNHFFEQRSAATAGQREEEEKNLEEKKALIERLNHLLQEMPENMRQLALDMQDEWNKIGFVPFRNKEQINKSYREVCDKIFDKVNSSRRKERLNNFKKNIETKGGNDLQRTKSRLRSLIDAKKAEIQSYETNLSFFNATSNKGNSIVADIERKIERLKTDLEDIHAQLKAANTVVKKEETEEQEAPAAE